MIPEVDCVDLELITVDFDGLVTDETVLSWLHNTYELAIGFGDTSEQAKKACDDHLDILKQVLMGEITFEQGSVKLKNVWTKNNSRIVRRKDLTRATHALGHYVRQELEVLFNCLQEFRDLGVKIFMITTATPLVIDFTKALFPLDGGIAAYVIDYIASPQGIDEDVFEGIRVTDEMVSRGFGTWKTGAFYLLAKNSGLDPNKGIHLGNNVHDGQAMERGPGRGILMTNNEEIYTGNNRNIVRVSNPSQVAEVLRKFYCPPRPNTG